MHDFHSVMGFKLQNWKVFKYSFSIQFETVVELCVDCSSIIQVYNQIPHRAESNTEEYYSEL